MSLISIGVGVAIAGGLAKRIMRNRSSESDLGFVSHQWIANAGFHGCRMRNGDRRSH